MYQALYRKYRPKDFDSVVGQDAIIKTLKNSIINHNFSHAYMFFGPRGTGKTTISKIFARNINCLSPKDGIACQECDHCKVSFSKNCVDIIEIDAASNNGVDEIRDLRSKIALVPSELKYKVYIIDEVHMLSIGAFNALLKTLEEPPEHAIFILATTDPQKVPETIISRCQCFSFKRIPEKVIEKRLKFVCEAEGINIDDEVLENIALLSDGGMRDSLGTLDKLTSYTNERITMDDFVEVNGIVSIKDIKEFLNSIMLGNIKEILIDIDEFNNNGKNLIQIMMQLLNFSRKLLVDYYISNKNCDYDIDKLQKFVNYINENMFDIKKSGNTMIYIEMSLLKFVNDFINLREKSQKIDNFESNQEKKSNLNVKNDKKEEEKVSNLVDTTNNSIEISIINKDDEVSNIKPVEDTIISNQDDALLSEEIPKILNIDEIMKVRVNNTLATASKALLKLEINNFETLRDYTFDQEIGYLVCAILDSKLRAVSSDNIIISYEFDSNVKQNLINIEKINDVYNKITNSNKNFAIISDNDWEKVRSEYINNLKNNVKYEVIPEPVPILEETKKDDIIVNSAIDLFGDIVEIS